MKKLLYFAFITGIILLASCKKNRSCVCTTTIGGSQSSSTTTTLEDMTKSEAKAACDDGDASISILGITTTTECELE